MAVNNANQLVSLDLSGCTKVDNSGIDRLSSAFIEPNLESLYLNGCTGVTHDSIAKLSYRCMDLINLGLKVRFILAKVGVPDPLQGCQVGRHTLRRMAASWRYTEVRINDRQYGYYAKYRARDRKFIDKNGAMWIAAVKIQVCLIVPLYLERL